MSLQDLKEYEAEKELYVDGFPLDITQVINQSEVIFVISKNKGSRCKNTPTRLHFHKCEICSKYISAHIFKYHFLKEHPEETINCNLCSNFFLRLDELNNHLIIAHPKNTFPVCLVCGFKFDTLEVLKEHLGTHCKRIKCDECPKTFKAYPSLVVHKNRDHEGARFPCDVCFKIFTDKDYLARHKLVHKPDYQPSKLYCDECDKDFVSKNGLKNHKRSIHELKKFVCHVCGKSVTSEMSLKNHLLTHSDEKKFVCDTCGKGFTTMKLLRVHLVVHTKIKRYVCEFCDKSYTQRGSLITHKRSVHTNDLRYDCDICGKKFVTKTLMNYHKRSHLM